MKNILKITLYLLIGFMLGLNFTIGQTDNVIYKEKQTKYYNSQTEFYDSMIEDLKTIKIYETAEITPEILASREGKIIVEKTLGKVTNYKLDGEILNCGNSGNYISYINVEGAKEGDKILTYFIYNPFTNEQDDILTRLDFIIDDNTI